MPSFTLPELSIDRNPVTPGSTHSPVFFFGSSLSTESLCSDCTGVVKLPGTVTQNYFIGDLDPTVSSLRTYCNWLLSDIKR